MAISDVTSTAAQAKSSSTSSKQIAQDFDQFLFLLTQQLKNQDPLEPMDTSEFTNQLVQFANVEQSISTNRNLENLIALQAANAGLGALNYIGKEVEALGNNVPLIDGQAKFKYSLPEDADVLTIQIKDKDGHIVRDLTGSKEKGAHDIVWDGKNNSGETMEDGSYTVEVKAIKNTETDPLGKKLDVQTAISGIVKSINNESGVPHVVLGSVAIPIGNIISTRTPPAPVTTGNNGTGNGDGGNGSGG